MFTEEQTKKIQEKVQWICGISKLMEKAMASPVLQCDYELMNTYMFMMEGFLGDLKKDLGR